MTIKYCIFNDTKLCDNCGECEVCDLDSNKKCNNCGKCLEQEGIDTKAIKIDTIFTEDEMDCFKEEVGEDIEEIDTPESELLDDYDDDISKENYSENTEPWVLIDDVDGLRDALEDEKTFEKIADESCPGMIKLKFKKHQN